MEDEQKQVRVTLGIDQSLTNSGIVVLDDKDEIIYKGTIKPPKLLKTDRKKTKRLVFIKEAILPQIGQSTILAMEDYSFATKGQSFYLGELGGMIKQIFERMPKDCMCMVIPPSMVKKFATSVGNADKSLMLKEVYKRWNQDFDNDNICDAYVIAKLAKAIHDVKKGIKGKDEFTTAQWDAIKTCIKRKVDEF